jgi:hypothetical protein
MSANSAKKRFTTPKDGILFQYGNLILGHQHFHSFQKEIDAFAFKGKES